MRSIMKSTIFVKETCAFMKKNILVEDKKSLGAVLMDINQAEKFHCLIMGVSN